MGGQILFSVSLDFIWVQEFLESQILLHCGQSCDCDWSWNAMKATAVKQIGKGSGDRRGQEDTEEVKIYLR